MGGASYDPPVADRAVACAPGRVNLIGEHTDYNDGLSLPFAIARGITVTATTTGGSEVVADVDARFVKGIAAELGFDGGARLSVESDLPIGAGLSSSAALCVAMSLALLELADRRMDRLAVARPGSRVGPEWIGAQ